LFIRILIDPFRRRRPMAWKKPRIVEIAVGMEINSYACAVVK
jgi:coenzyme PQQ precursor peptide PqqA